MTSGRTAQRRGGVGLAAAALGGSAFPFGGGPKVTQRRLGGRSWICGGQQDGEAGVSPESGCFEDEVEVADVGVVEVVPAVCWEP
jgi:hypothetical protein